MNILLLNTNPVVSRLLSLCVRDGDTVLEEVTDASAVKRDRYDIVFVDDASYVAEVEELLHRLMFRKKVCLAAKQSEEGLFDSCDEVITKPFLPSQITAVLESSLEEVEVHAEVQKEVEEEVSIPFIFPLSTDDEQSEAPILDESEESEPEESTVEEPSKEDQEDGPAEEEEPEIQEILESSEMILDSSEIERIKALLDEDEPEEEVLALEDEEEYEARKVEVITEHLEDEGLEIIEENQIADLLSRQSESENRSKSKKEKEKKKKKFEKKKEKQKKQQNEVSETLEKALLKALEEMKPKKIKKLLKGAEVTIKINFKDEN